jgi:cell division protein ZapA
MAQVTVTIQGRAYDLACDDGQEAHLLALAQELDSRARRLSSALGQIGEARLLLLSALLIADELYETRGRLGETERQRAEQNQRLVFLERRQTELTAANREAAAGALEKAAERIDALAARLGDA